VTLIYHVPLLLAAPVLLPVYIQLVASIFILAVSLLSQTIPFTRLFCRPNKKTIRKRNVRLQELVNENMRSRSKLACTRAYAMVRAVTLGVYKERTMFEGAMKALLLATTIVVVFGILPFELSRVWTRRRPQFNCKPFCHGQIS